MLKRDYKLGLSVCRLQSTRFKLLNLGLSWSSYMLLKFTVTCFLLNTNFASFIDHLQSFIKDFFTFMANRGGGGRLQWILNIYHHFWLNENDWWGEQKHALHWLNSKYYLYLANKETQNIYLHYGLWHFGKIISNEF